MTSLRAALRTSWPAHRAAVGSAALASATLGLAPFSPHAHIRKQLANLWHARLTAPIDVFDLCLHGAPWLWLLGALALWLRQARRIRATEGPPAT